MRPRGGISIILGVTAFAGMVFLPPANAVETKTRSWVCAFVWPGGQQVLERAVETNGRLTLSSPTRMNVWEQWPVVQEGPWGVLAAYIDADGLRFVMIMKEGGVIISGTHETGNVVSPQPDRQQRGTCLPND